MLKHDKPAQDTILDDAKRDENNYGDKESMNDNPPGLESNAIEEENNMNGEHTVISRDDECTMSCKGFGKHATIRIAMNKSKESEMERTSAHETCGDPGMSLR